MRIVSPIKNVNIKFDNLISKRYYCNVFIFLRDMQYTPAVVTQIAQQTWMSAYADYAFLLWFVQWWSSKRSLAKKRTKRTQKLFAHLHAQFVDDTIAKQKKSFDKEDNDISKTFCDDELDIRLQEV